MKKKRIYFVGNAHLDPVWLWRWQEGSCEAKATIRSALDRMSEYPDFKFVCSSASVFEWIEEFDPEMFEEVKARVLEGRFVIVGGWHVQPDCNLPSGEGFARQSLYSQRYFKEKFGKCATVGYNVDSFGHNLMLPQILRKSGMDSYVFMRPGVSEKDMPSDLFVWQSPDGSEVTALRIMDSYTHDVKDITELEEKLGAVEKDITNETDCMHFFFGVGNHGGGPTKKNIEAVMALREKYPEHEIIFSDTEDIFAYLRKAWVDKLPVHKDDLQHHASGCYSAVASIKNAIRRAECDLYSSEIFSYMGNRLLSRRLNPKTLEAAWKNVMFCHFHDIFGGCCIKDAYSDADYMLGESRSIAKREENNALQSISWKIDTSDSERGYPIIVFNSLPYEVNEIIHLGKYALDIKDSKGGDCLRQYVHPTAYSCYFNPDTIFTAKIPAMGYATYYAKYGPMMGGNKYKESQIPRSGMCSDDAPTEVDMAQMPFVEAGDGYLESERFRVEFDKECGGVRSMYDKRERREVISSYSAIVIDESEHDTWSHAKNFFDKEIGKFSSASLEVIEEGPIRAKIRAISTYGKSTLTQDFILTASGEGLSVNAVVDWHEEHKMLKLAYKINTAGGERAYYEIPFGVIERPVDGEEEPGLSWCALSDGERGVAMLNNNKYSFSVKGNEMSLTAIRSPLYNDHGGGDDGQCEYTDQGVHSFEYTLMPFAHGDFASLTRAARQLNIKPTVILENNHNGILPDGYRGISVLPDNIMLSALKPAEDGDGIILRAYETNGVQTDAQICGDLLPEKLCATFTPYAVNTYRYSYKNKAWREVLFTEYEIGD